jgi:Arc/MetJ family transcription regulator
MARTVLNIDEETFEKARRLTGLRKKVDVVNYALRRLVEQKELESVLELRGTVEWDGVLEEMRRDRDGGR